MVPHKIEAGQLTSQAQPDTKDICRCIAGESPKLSSKVFISQQYESAAPAGREAVRSI